MKIELRNLKLLTSKSEETPCFSATVYVDDKPAVDVRNEGRGGADVQRARAGYSLTAIEAFIEATFPKVSMARHGMDDIPCSLELWCHEQAWEQDARARFQRAMKKAVLYIADGELLEIRFKNVRSIDSRCLAHLAEKRPDIAPLNTMAFEAAWALAKPLMMRA